MAPSIRPSSVAVTRDLPTIHHCVIFRGKSGTSIQASKAELCRAEQSSDRLSKQQQQSEEKVGIDHESPKRRFLALSQSHQTYGTHFSLMVTSWDLPLTHSVTLPSTLRHENSIGSFFVLAQHRRVGRFGDTGDCSPRTSAGFVKPISIRKDRLYPSHRLVPTKF